MLGLLKVGVFTILWLPLAAVGLYAFALTIYRLVFSPLAKFPGPKLAALTRKYESYYEAVQNYEYLWKIKQMHQKYGKLLVYFSSLIYVIFPPWSRMSNGKPTHLLMFRTHCSHQPARTSRGRCRFL